MRLEKLFVAADMVDSFPEEAMSSSGLPPCVIYSAGDYDLTQWPTKLERCAQDPWAGVHGWNGSIDPGACFGTKDKQYKASSPFGLQAA